MATGMQTFLKLAGLYGPEPEQDEEFADMPANLPVNRQNPMAPVLINRASSSQLPVNGRYQDVLPAEDMQPEIMEQEGMSPLDMFRQSVMNPPQREHMTYPKNTLAGLDAALKIAARPSPLEKTRVYLDGQPYQKQRIYTDPVTGEKKVLTTTKEPGFWDNVLEAMPAAISPVTDILNQPHQDAVADWKLKNEGLKDYVSAENNAALAAQRAANTAAIPVRLNQGQQKIDISRMSAEEKKRLSQLNTLTDREKIDLLQQGKIDVAELQAAAAMARTEVQQAGATERTGMQQAGANQRNQASIAGAKERTQMQQEGATERTGMQQEGADRRNQASIAGAEKRNQDNIRARGSRATGQSATQQRVEIQRRTAEVLSNNPEYEDYITFDERGFPVIEADDPDIQQQIYQQIYGNPRTDIALPNVPTATTPSGQVAPIGTPNMVMAPNAPRSTGEQKVIKQYSPSRNQTRISTDGGKTWKVVAGRQ